MIGQNILDTPKDVESIDPDLFDEKWSGGRPTSLPVEPATAMPVKMPAATPPPRPALSSSRGSSLTSPGTDLNDDDEIGLFLFLFF